MIDFETRLAGYQTNISPEKIESLIESLGPSITKKAIFDLGVGCNVNGDVFYFPERDAHGNVIGLMTRSVVDNAKRTVKGSKRGLYISKLLADQGGLLVMTEGPSDTAAMLSAGFDGVGRPSAMGGCQLASEFVGNYLDREIIVIADQDDGAGEKGARKVAEQIVSDWGVAVTVVICPDDFKDPRDWLNAHPELDKDDIEAQLRQNVIEVFEPADDTTSGLDGPGVKSSDDGDSVPIISNFHLEQSGDKPRRVGLMAYEILQQVQDQLDDGIYSLKAESLFVTIGDELREIKNHDELLAYLDQVAKVDWADGSDMISAKRFFIFCLKNCEHFKAIETFPHVPEVDGTFYACPKVEPAETGRLDELVNMLNPLTDHDRALVKAMFLTVVWGGPPGSRPVFIVTGPPNDASNGVGVGKSKLVEIVSQLVGGMMSFGSNDKPESMMKRLLSPGATGKRVAVIDNVKSYKFSWAEFEGLVTAPVISGHRMYVGEGQRPNDKTWFITINGASTSKDIAERAFIIKLARPTYESNWQLQVSEFIETHRWEIFADIKYLIEEN